MICKENGLALSVSAARCHLSQRERQRISQIQLLLAMSRYRLSLWESWRKAPERASFLRIIQPFVQLRKMCSIIFIFELIHVTNHRWTMGRFIV